MYRVESLKLFGDISKISDKYKSWHLKDDENEIKDNRKLKTLLNYHNSRFDRIKEKYDFLSYQTKNELKNKSKDELHKILNEFNNFSYKKFSSLKNSNIESTTVKAVMFATIDELSLINESIRKKDYLENKNLYFNIYENVALNAFITFLSLRDMNIIKQEDLNDLSQAIFTQIQSIAISSI